jgi:hypothetical protein
VAYNFNGSSQYASFSPTGFPTGTNPRTMVGWGRPSTTAAGFGWIVAYGSTGTNNMFAIGRNASAAYYACFGGINDLNVASKWVVGEWHHMAFTYSGSQLLAYFDGGLVASKSGVTLTTTATAGRLASRMDSSLDMWAGDVAEAAAWNVVLTDAEIAQLGMGFSPFCLTARLANLLWYRSLIRDLNWPGIGPTLTAAGGPAVVEHPRLVYPANPTIGLFAVPQFVAPYRLAAATAHANRIRRGWAAVAGPSVGDIYSIGEVSS